MRGEKGKLIVNGTPTQTPTSPAKTLIQPIKLNSNDKITISANNTVGIGTSADYVSLRFAGTINGVFNYNIFEVICTTANAKKTFTVAEPIIITNILVRGNTNVTFNNFILKPQLELNQTATTYEPHQGKELSLDLGNIELCKIGNYQDYFYKNGSKWYLHKEIGKIVFDGSSDESFSYSSGNIVFYTDTITDLVKRNSTLICNLFKSIANGTGYATIGNGEIKLDGTNSGRIILKITDYTNVTDFKTWLASNNVILYYLLNTATDTEITDTTLISQLEAIYNAPLYEKTNITQTNNDLPMVLDITACKDNINGIKAFIRK